jgi:hypothetical protein
LSALCESVSVCRLYVCDCGLEIHCESVSLSVHVSMGYKCRRLRVIVRISIERKSVIHLNWILINNLLFKIYVIPYKR